MNSPSSEQKVIDRFGQEYFFELFYDQEDALSIYLYRNNRQVGHIFCNFKNGEMEIADVIVWDNVVHGQRGCLFELLRLIGWKPKVTNYRNRGLGSFLLSYAINRAGQRGIKKIYGTVKPHDREDTPHLLSWYQKNGFNIHKSKGHEGVKPIYFISMDLR